MNDKTKGIVRIGVLALAIYAYGRSKYDEGRKDYHESLIEEKYQEYTNQVNNEGKA